MHPENGEEEGRRATFQGVLGWLGEGGAKSDVPGCDGVVGRERGARATFQGVMGWLEGGGRGFYRYVV